MRESLEQVEYDNQRSHAGVLTVSSSSAAWFGTLDVFGIPYDISLDVLLLLHIFFDALDRKSVV